MKEETYFRQASQDRTLRLEKVAELRYHRKFALVVLVFCVLLAIGFSFNQGLAEGKWLAGTDSFGPTIILCLWIYTNNGTRMAALLAMEVKEPEPTRPLAAPIPA